MEQTSEQKLILENKEGSLRVLAGAGSGKTTTMALKVQDEIESKRCRPEEICFITFTRFASDQIKKKVYGIMGKGVNILCGTFHSMMYKMLRLANIQKDIAYGLYDVRMEIWVNHFMDLVRERNIQLVRILRSYKLLIVDEFQDLDEIQFEFVSLFKEIQPSLRILAIGDLAQNIYRFRGTSNEFLRTLLQKEVCPEINTFNLTTNFRSTKAILSVVNTIFKEEIDDGHILPMIPYYKTEQGKKPQYYEYAINPQKGIGEYEEQVANTLLPILIDGKKNGKSIALIFPIIKCQSFELIMALLRQYSKANNFVLDLHKIAKEDETCNTVAFGYDIKNPKAPIQFSTIHSSKGLEWDIVALIDISDGIYNLRSEEDCEGFYAEKTNLTYVAITRAAEELYIFANANNGGRHRKFAQLGEGIENLFDTTYWGTEPNKWEISKKKPIGITELVRRFPQHPDLFKRARECSQNIKSYARDGMPMRKAGIYDDMKKKNREMAFGTFIDWKLKKIFCKEQTFQDIILELIACYPKKLFFHRTDALENLSLRMAKIDIYFMNADKNPIAPLQQYVLASRYLAFHSSRCYSLTNTIRSIYDEVEWAISKASKKEVRTIKDEYILSQLKNFYTRGSVSEIHAVDAPRHMYMGMPENYEEFVSENIQIGTENINVCFKENGASGKLQGDVCLESESLIMGEADIISENGVLLEIKCGTSNKAVEMRDVGNCKHLLQVLSYVALARHGTIPIDLHKACIVNPLTGTWEIYDLSTWSEKDSMEFMQCLEELRDRQ
jgi:hypothetical protein